MVTPRISDHVMCERLGEGEFKILSEDRDHFQVQSITDGSKHKIYKVHCHVPPKLAFANQRRRTERAGKIGR